MTRYSFGDVVLVPFPFTDQTTTKQRPAVVVSSDAYQQERPDLILMAITSQTRPVATVGEVAVQEWKQAGLLKPSVLKPLLTTIQRSLLRKQLGALGADDRRALRDALDAILGS